MPITSTTTSVSGRRKSSPSRGAIRSTSTNTTNNTTPEASSSRGVSFLTKYFLVILFLFGCLSLVLNSRFTDEDVSVLQEHLDHSVGMNKNNNNNAPPVITRKAEQRNNNNLATKEAENENLHSHRISGLNCDKWGGPSPEVAQEMVYWEDIPSDAQYISPFHPKRQKDMKDITQYMTFESDQGGWNNIRMAMETVLGMAFAMGRTLVLPPHQPMYLLTKGDKKQRKEFSYEHFFHMESISAEHVGLDIISMKEFLEIAKTGVFRDSAGNNPIYPPRNRTDWNGASKPEQMELKRWLRGNAEIVKWNPEDCLAAFPKSNTPNDMEALVDLKTQMGGFPEYETFINKPNPVDASPKDRLKENRAGRKELCLYTPELQQTPWIHFAYDHKEFSNRLLVHFYAFLFFQDWRHDLWMKRFVRDHVRYIDEIQCATARVVQGIRARVKQRGQTDFDTLHVRRGDFQYTVTRAEAEDIYKMTSKQIPDNTTVYIATDERRKDFFDPLKKHYDVVFLEDFVHELQGVNTNYYGMIDQLVASRGRVFYGCWFSTFTGYINRLRGYHADDHQTPGYEMGVVPSYYYSLKDRYMHMQEFYPVKKSFYAREFPASWRLIDSGINDSNLVQKGSITED